MRYEVPVLYRGRCNFIIEADTPEQAREMARLSFKGGLAPDNLGNEWEEVEWVGGPLPIADATVSSP